MSYKREIEETIEKFRKACLLPGKKLKKETSINAREVAGDWRPNGNKLQKIFASVGCLKCCVKILSLQGKKFSKLIPCKIRATQKFFPLHWKSRSRYYRWFQKLASNAFLNPELAVSRVRYAKR
jgi:hypothetical protein